MNLKGSKTEQNLKAAFAGESQAHRRYLYFARKADVEGFNDVSAAFRSTAEGKTGHAHGGGGQGGGPSAGREGSHEAPTPPSDRVADGGVLRFGRSREGARAGIRHLSRLPPLLQPLHAFPRLFDAVDANCGSRDGCRAHVRSFRVPDAAAPGRSVAYRLQQAARQGELPRPRSPAPARAESWAQDARSAEARTGHDDRSDRALLARACWNTSASVSSRWGPMRPGASRIG
jgi:hypothetical protein